MFVKVHSVILWGKLILKKEGAVLSLTYGSFCETVEPLSNASMSQIKASASISWSIERILFMCGKVFITKKQEWA